MELNSFDQKICDIRQEASNLAGEYNRLNSFYEKGKHKARSRIIESRLKELNEKLKYYTS